MSRVVKIVIEFRLRAGVDVERTDAAIATARHVYANNEKMGRIKKFPFTHQAGPPFGGFAVGCKRMKYPHDIVLCLIKCSMCGISQVIAMQLVSGFEREGFFIDKLTDH